MLDGVFLWVDVSKRKEERLDDAAVSYGPVSLLNEDKRGQKAPRIFYQLLLIHRRTFSHDPKARNYVLLPSSSDTDHSLRLASGEDL